MKDDRRLDMRWRWFAHPAVRDRALGFAPSRVASRPAVTIPCATLCPSPGAVGPASRLWRRYADAPAAALLTGLGAGEWLRHMPFDERSVQQFEQE